jgi:hypothetical protein
LEKPKRYARAHLAAITLVDLLGVKLDCFRLHCR